MAAFGDIQRDIKNTPLTRCRALRSRSILNATTLSVFFLPLQFIFESLNTLELYYEHVFDINL